MKETILANLVGAVLVGEQFSDHKYLGWEGYGRHFLHILSTSTQGPGEGFAISFEADSEREGFAISLEADPTGEGFAIFPLVWGSGVLGMADSSQQYTFAQNVIHSGLPLLHTQYDCESRSKTWWHKYNRKWQSQRSGSWRDRELHQRVRESSLPVKINAGIP